MNGRNRLVGLESKHKQKRGEEMKLLLIGHTGNTWAALVEGFQQLPEVELITASRSSGDHQVEIVDADSVSQLFAATGKVDAIVSAAGSTVFKTL